MNNIFKRFLLCFHPDFLTKSIAHGSGVIPWMFWFFWHIVFVAVIGGITFFVAQPFTDANNPQIQELFSTIPDIELQIQDGILTSTGLEEPFIYPIDDDILLYIDRSSQQLPDDIIISETQSYIYINSSEITGKTGDETRTFSFGNVGDSSIRKIDIIEGWDQGMNLVLPIMISMIVIGLFIFSAIFGLIWNIIGATILNIISQIFGTEGLTFTKSYQTLLTVFPLTYTLYILLIWSGISMVWHLPISMGMIYLYNYTSLKLGNQKTD